FLITPIDHQLTNTVPPPVTFDQLNNLRVDAPIAPKIQEVLDDLGDIRLTTEVFRVFRLMHQKDTLKRQIEDIIRTTRPYEQSLLQAKMGLASIKNCLEEAQAYTKITDH